MTEITGFIRPTRRPGALGVHSLDHFSMTVPDLARAREFYTTFGLDVREEDGKLGLYIAGQAHRWALLSAGREKRLHYLSFGAFEDDMQRFRDRFGHLNIERLPPPPGFESNGLWFRDPDGTPIEIKVAQKTSPSEKSTFEAAPNAGSLRGAPIRKQGGPVTPRRLAHLAVYTRDVTKAIAFYRDVLGLRLSDQSGGNVAFLHGVHGSDHHLVAFARSEGPGLHHCSWDVGSIADIGLGAMQMAKGGFVQGWGVGRHVLGSNYFHYVRDPWGSYSEYSADMDYIPVDLDWNAEDHADEDAFYQWGPNPPDDFIRNYEVS